MELRASTFAWSFLSTVSLFVAVTVPLWLLLESPSGDLARIGRWAERDFGWHVPQPEVALHRNGSGVSAPDLLVLGDSFSRANVWQSQLAQLRRLTVLSFAFDDVGCLDNWLRWAARTPHRSARTVVLQSVERLFVERFERVAACRPSAPRPFEVDAAMSSATRPRWPPVLDIDYLSRTAINTLRLRATAGRIDSAGVINAPLTTAALFSNRRADRLLYLADEDAEAARSPVRIDGAIANVRRLQREFAMRGIRLVLLVIPDKSTVYAPYFADATARGVPDLFERLRAADIDTIDSLHALRAALPGTVDLYLPDDSHLSAAGFGVLAAALAARL